MDVLWGCAAFRPRLCFFPALFTDCERSHSNCRGVVEHILALCTKADIMVRRMTMLFLFMPLVALLMAINVILGCYVTVLLGYGPPNWQTALNQVVPLTVLQDYLNEGRDWLKKKAPKVDALLNRLHAPKPIIFIDTTVVDDEEEIDDEEPEEQTEESSEASTEEESNQETNAGIPANSQEKTEL